jgi:putative DNA primase/helicase
MTVSRNQRYTKRSRCPICDGCEQDPREQGRRCIGYLSADEEWARCSREECAGGLELEERSGCYVHKLRGPCKCGETHGEATTRVQDAIEATYDYYDESGTLLYQVVRKTGKRFQQRRPDPSARGGWTWKTAGVRRVLYRLPELLAAPPDETVVIVEGEKDAETLARRGIVVTTNAQGAGKWNTVADLARNVLRGRNVVVIADADDPGRKHAKQIVASLTGVTATLEAFEPTKGKDVTDHIEAGGTYDELMPLGSSVPTPPVPSVPPPPPTPSTPPPAEVEKPQLKFKNGDHVEMGSKLLELLQNDSRVAIVGDEQDLYGYNPSTGLYSIISLDDQSRIVQGFSGSFVKNKKNGFLFIKASDVRGTEQLAYSRVSRPSFFSTTGPGLVFKNGFVVVDETGIHALPNSPDNRARFGYGFDYDPDASSGIWLKFLSDIFRDDEDKDQKIACLQEHLGASLLGIATKFQRCIVCIGDGGEGKSTYSEIVESIFPPGSVAHIPPQEWGQEYRRAFLASKLLNVVAELPESDILASESFKAIVTGDPIDGRHIRQALFTFRPVAGQLFMANRLPGTQDQTPGFWRRFIIIRFTRSFSGDTERDPEIAAKVVGASRSAIVSWALLGAARLLRNKSYTLPKSHERELGQWRRVADQISAFFDEKLGSRRLGYGTKASVAYGAYRDWAEQNGHHAMSSSRFSARLREMGFPSKKEEDFNVYPIEIIGYQSFRLRGVDGALEDRLEAKKSQPPADSDENSSKDPRSYN